jgi:hypothetical protein
VWYKLNFLFISTDSLSDPWPVHLRYVVDNVALVRVTLNTSVYVVRVIPQMFHTHLYPNTRVHIFNKDRNPPENFRHQKGDMKQVSCREPTNISRHRTEFSRWASWRAGFVGTPCPNTTLT